MESTRHLLDKLRAQLGSDGKLAAQLGVSQVTVSRWRSPAFPDLPSDENAVELAKLLDVDPVYVLAVVRADRTKSDETRAAWVRVAERFKDAAVVAAVAIGAAVSPSPGQAAPSQGAKESTLYIMSTRRRKRAGWSDPLARLLLPFRPPVAI